VTANRTHVSRLVRTLPGPTEVGTISAFGNAVTAARTEDDEVHWLRRAEDWQRPAEGAASGSATRCPRQHDGQVRRLSLSGRL
jgi:hypothetical protein